MKKAIYVFLFASFESVIPFLVALQRAWVTRKGSYSSFDCPRRRRQVALFLPLGWSKTQCLKCPNVWLCRLLRFLAIPSTDMALKALKITLVACGFSHFKHGLRSFTEHPEMLSLVFSC